MIGKIKAFWALFQAGQRVADAAKWKTRQIEVTALAAVLWGAIHVAESFGIEVPVGGETVDAVAVGVIALVNGVLTVITTNKIGLQPKPETPPR